MKSKNIPLIIVILSFITNISFAEVSDEYLIKTYEPVLYFYPEEKEYYPMKVEPYVVECSLWDDYFIDELVLPEGEVDLSKLSAYDEDDFYLSFVYHEGVEGINIESLSEQEWHIKAWAIYNAMSEDERKPAYYAHVVHNEEKGCIAIQYWFFYAMSSWGVYEPGFANVHEGDWEMITVFLNSISYRPVYIAYAQHINVKIIDKKDHDKWIWDELPIENNTHPVVYVARGSHASYYSEGNHWQIIGNDLTSKYGRRIAPGEWQRCIIGGDSYTDWGWFFDYEGRWGTNKLTDIIGDGSSGPYGPPAKGDKYYHPSDWAEISSTDISEIGSLPFMYPTQATSLVPDTIYRGQNNVDILQIKFDVINGDSEYISDIKFSLSGTYTISDLNAARLIDIDGASIWTGTLHSNSISFSDISVNDYLTLKLVFDISTSAVTGHTLHVILDADDIDCGNTCPVSTKKFPIKSNSTTIVEPSQTPDLTLTSVNAPSSAKPGDSINVSFTIKNQGTAPSGSFHNLISLATTPHRTDTSLGNFPMNSIGAGSSLSDTKTVQIPGDVSPGDYYVTVYADSSQVIDESNENNNIGSTSISIPRDDAAFVADVTIPDGTEMSRGQSFTKIWKIKNTGTTTWTSGYKWAFVSGSQMSGPDSKSVSGVSPGSTYDVSVNLIAPTSPGTYTGYWRMKNASDQWFGTKCWVNIIVIEDRTTWNFDHDGDKEGWTPMNVDAWSVHHDAFFIDPSGIDPYIFSPPLSSVDASDYDSVETKIISNCPDRSGAIYFTTDSSPVYDPDKLVPFEVINDGQWREYKIFMGDHAKWQGQITGIRIDPAESGIAGTANDTTGWDYIRLTKEDGCFFADLDCDGDVDTEDVRRIAIYWDTQVGDALYNPDYDFNHDNKINLLDVRTVAQYWGQTAPFSIAAPSIVQVNSNPRAILAYLQASSLEIRIGESATVTLLTEVAEELQGMEFRLSYDSQKLKATYVGLGKHSPVITLGPKINYQKGTISIGAVLLGKQGETALTSKVLVNLKFTAQQQGESALILQDIKLINGSENLLPVVRQQPLKIKITRPRPRAFALGQNFPNPFNPETWLPYQLAKASQVQIMIYNVLGQLIRTLNLGYKHAGYYQDKVSAGYWNGKNESGEKATSGIYFYKIQAGSFQAVRKMVIAK